MAHELSREFRDRSRSPRSIESASESAALEFTVVGAQAQIIATSSDRPMDMLPMPATDEMMMQAAARRART